MGEIKKIKPSLPKGTRDFLPEEVARRNYIFDTIKGVFRKYGFQQIDTPAFERLETLTGKYGEEGDRLLFKILNSGDFLKDAPETDLEAKNSAVISKHITEKGLRYDLTVPLARYVVQHQEDLAFPFKRFHIGPVWRADRPQKGRYQEFYQCDADVIGSTSLLNEVELTQIYVEVFRKLKINVQIHYSNRKYLYGLAQYCSADDHFDEFVSILDKQDKMDFFDMLNLFRNHNVFKNRNTAAKIEETLNKFNELQHDYAAIFDFFRKSFESINCQIGLDGLEEIIRIRYEYDKLNLREEYPKLIFNTYLARGLNYYSGTIWEVIPVVGIKIGSLGGGGRYDNLTEMFGGRDMSGVGISFGIERIYDVMEELGLFPADLDETTKVLFVHFDNVSEAYAFEALQKVRAADIASEIYPGRKKLDKQMNYANDKKIPYVVVVGSDEIASGKLTLKNMISGEQEKMTIGEIVERLK